MNHVKTLGVATCHEIMRQLPAITGSDRYRPSLWLRRRAQLGLSIYAVCDRLDFTRPQCGAGRAAGRRPAAA